MFKISIDSKKHGLVWVTRETLEEVEQYKTWCAESAHWGMLSWVEDVPEKVELEIVDGVEYQKTIPGYQIVHPSEYELIIEDISNEVNQAKINQEALEFLAASDWYLIREMETGLKMPDEIREERAKARASVVHG